MRFIDGPDEANHTMRTMLVGKFPETFAVDIGVWQNDGQAQLVIRKLLKKFACQSTVKIEELWSQIILGEHETCGTDGGAKHVGDITREANRET